MPGFAGNSPTGGQLALQERSLRRAINADPGDADARYNLGVILQQLQRHEEAIENFRASLRIRAGADALLNIGVSLHALGRYTEALGSYAQALELDPGAAEAHNNAGNALQALGRHEESLAYYDRAIAANPGYLLAHNNRGNALKAIARYRDAIASYRRALEIDPQNADAHHLTGLTQLCLGEYAQGWQGLEWRWKTPGAAGPPRKLSQPLWHGSEDLRGKSILLQAEQGLGDTIQFARYAPLVAERGATVLLDQYAPLVPLMQGIPGVSRVLAPQDPVPPIDFQCPLLSLPLAFGTTLDTIPPAIPYLTLALEEASSRRAKLGGGGAKLVGLCWRGKPGYVNDAQRSIRFAELAPLWSVPDVRFVSLQKELTDDEHAQALALTHFVHPGADFRSTAEMIAALDLVITVDTAWLHWAGSIGKPAWALLDFAPHWAWLTEREDSPWYPSVRLLRQAAPGEWRRPIGTAARMLASLVAR